MEQQKNIQEECVIHPEQKRLYKLMTPEQKLKCTLSLYKSAWQLKLCGLRQQHPDWSEERVKRTVREIFLYART